VKEFQISHIFQVTNFRATSNKSDRLLGNFNKVQYIQKKTNNVINVNKNQIGFVQTTTKDRV